ncbi:MAG TPA: PaaI family thioesterase [Acidimicrobiia bacterium]
MFHETDRSAISELLRQAGADKLPGHMGLELIEIAERAARMRCEIQPYHLAPNGYLHAGAVITLADTAAGYGCVGNFPEGATGFTTIELKTNFTGTLLEGTMLAEAEMIHGGRTTQVWDVEVSDESTGRKLALFRATQMILYRRD